MKNCLQLNYYHLFRQPFLYTEVSGIVILYWNLAFCHPTLIKNICICLFKHLLSYDIDFKSAKLILLEVVLQCFQENVAASRLLLSQSSLSQPDCNLTVDNKQPGSLAGYTNLRPVNYTCYRFEFIEWGGKVYFYKTSAYHI